jgi:hypothetical protein
VALAAATITKLNARHGTKYLAQLTRKDTFIEGDATYGVADEAVLEAANEQAQEAVREKVGSKTEDHWAVIDLTIYFLLPPGDDTAETRWTTVMGRLTPGPGTSQSTGVDPSLDSSSDRRRYGGDDFENDANLQANSRPRRSSF